MKKKHRLREGVSVEGVEETHRTLASHAMEKEKEILLSFLSKEIGVPMRKVLKPVEHYAQFFSVPRECCTFEQIDDYAHGQIVDEKVVEHIRECDRCFRFTELIRKYSLKLHPENSKFESFWEKRQTLVKREETS